MYRRVRKLFTFNVYLFDICMQRLGYLHFNVYLLDIYKEEAIYMFMCIWYISV